MATLLESFGVDYDLICNPDIPLQEQMIQALRKHGPRYYDVVTGLGGDGTHSLLINELVKHRAAGNFELPSYAIIPMGTGNNIAKSFTLNSREDFFVNDLRRAVSTIIYGADYRLDLGRLGDRYFVDGFTVGLDPRILRDHNIQKRKLQRFPALSRLIHGNFLYAFSTSRAFLRHTLLEGEVLVDGKSWYKGPLLNLIVNNTRIYAGEFDFCSDAYANDGKLDVVLFAEHHDYLGKFMLSFRGNPRNVRKFADKLNQVAMHTQGREIEIILNEDAPAQIDGEEYPSASHFKMRCIPSAITLKTPAEPG